MAKWLNAVREVLDSTEKPARIFFRDDDAGWANDKLYGLLDKFAQAGLPIDVAVIPGALDQPLAEQLLSRRQASKQRIGFHQHGYHHHNHEPEGRKCEFGRSRSKTQQKADIAEGQAYLRSLLGNSLDPFFTPPWNRCTQTTVECLAELEFKLLSRDATALRLEPMTLQQVPVHIDWSRIILNTTNPLTELGDLIANNLKHNDLTGIMLHHADMVGEHLQVLAALLDVFAHHRLQGLLLRETIG